MNDLKTATVRQVYNTAIQFMLYIYIYMHFHNLNKATIETTKSKSRKNLNRRPPARLQHYKNSF